MTWSRQTFSEGATKYTAPVGNNTELGVEESKTKAESALSTLQSKAQVETIAGEYARRAESPAARAVSTTNIASLKGIPAAVDGVTLVEGDLVLLTGQSTGTQNGLWEVKKGTTAWVRPVQFATGSEQLGVFTPIIEGTLYSGAIWVLHNSTKVTVDTTSETWVVNSPGSGVTGTGSEFVNIYPGNSVALGKGALAKVAVEAKAVQEEAFDNTGIGLEALAAATKGHSNTALGRESLKSLTTGTFNVALGPKCLVANVESSANVAVGFDCLPLFTKGLGEFNEGYNVAIGSDVMFKLKGGCDNVAIGTASMEESKGSSSDATIVANNVCVGNNAGLSIQGKQNTAVGASAYFGPCEPVKANGEATGNANTAIGFRALRGKETGGQEGVPMSAAENTVIGAEAMGEGVTGSCTTTASQNVAIGRWAMLKSTTGSFNTAVGYAAGALATGTLKGCVYLGCEAGHGNTTDETLYIHNGSSAEPLVFGNFSSREVKLNAEKVALYKGVTAVSKHAAIAAIGNTATGTEIATAVNAIREAIKGIGVTA